MDLNKLKKELEKEAFGDTAQSDREKGLCVSCHLPALERCYSDAGRKEYRISGLCEKCFDGMFEGNPGSDGL